MRGWYSRRLKSPGKRWDLERRRDCISSTSWMHSFEAMVERVVVCSLGRGAGTRGSQSWAGLTRGFAGEVLQVLVGVCDEDVASIGHQRMARGTEDDAGGTSTVRLNSITATVWERRLSHVRHCGPYSPVRGLLVVVFGPGVLRRRRQTGAVAALSRAGCHSGYPCPCPPLCCSPCAIGTDDMCASQHWMGVCLRAPWFIVRRLQT